jgi:hypothetical protein
MFWRAETEVLAMARARTEAVEKRMVVVLMGV